MGNRRRAAQAKAKASVESDDDEYVPTKSMKKAPRKNPRKDDGASEASDDDLRDAATRKTRRGFRAPAKPNAYLEVVSDVEDDLDDGDDAPFEEDTGFRRDRVEDEDGDHEEYLSHHAALSIMDNEDEVLPSQPRDEAMTTGTVEDVLALFAACSGHPVAHEGSTYAPSSAQDQAPTTSDANEDSVSAPAPPSRTSSTARGYTSLQLYIPRPLPSPEPPTRYASVPPSTRTQQLLTDEAKRARNEAELALADRQADLDELLAEDVEDAMEWTVVQMAWYERDEAKSLLEEKQRAWARAARALRAVKARDGVQKSEPEVIDLLDETDGDDSSDEDYVDE